MESLLRQIKKLLPSKLFRVFQPLYHYKMAFWAALIYRFPSRQIKVVAVTGTKGKTSTVEFINSILEEAGFKTALAGTLRFKIGNVSRPNLYKMTMPGRFFIQKFLRGAVVAHCDWAIIEMTSEGARQFRHKFIDLDALVFLNIAPEHIESHGSYEKYLAAKLELARALEKSRKTKKVLVVNIDDKEAKKFLAVNIADKKTFSLADARPYSVSDSGIQMTFAGEKIASPLPGIFNIYNILAATTFAHSQNIPPAVIKRGIEKVRKIEGRAEDIFLEDKNLRAKQNFRVIIDYAHTPDSLKALYEAFGNKRKICVLGNTGGGRDIWKRSEMAKIADAYCAEIILTDEDPYDDDPRVIVEEMSKAISKPHSIIMNRREAIREAIKKARAADVILITGKGTDPYIMRANGTREPWNDAKVAQEELEKIIR